MKLRENLALKAAAFLLAVAACVGASAMTLYQFLNFDVIWGDLQDGLATSFTVQSLELHDYIMLRDLLALYCAQDAELSTYEEQEKAAWESALDAQNTNLRWQVRDSTGRLRFCNTQEDVPALAEGLYESSVYIDYFKYSDLDFDLNFDLSFDAHVAYGDWLSMVEQAVNTIDSNNVVYSASWKSDLMMAASDYEQGGRVFTDEELDAVYLDADGFTDLLMVSAAGHTYVYGPTVRSCLEVNEYGFRYEGEWVQEEIPAVEYMVITMWLDTAFPVDDSYRAAYHALASWQDHKELLLAVNIACVAAGLLLTVYLCAGAGHKRGVEGIYLHGFHRIPGDLLLAVIALGVTVGERGTEALMDGLLGDSSLALHARLWMLVLGALAACVFALMLALLMTFAARCKARTLWKNTLIRRLLRLIGRLCRWFGRLIGSAVAAVPLIWKTVAAGLAYALFSALAPTGLRLGGTAVVIAVLCLWSLQWKRIRRGTGQIIGGHPDAHIDTRRMLPDLKSHADELNNLGQAISAAVDEQMKSERFKAELITNVSHDLKTPLTSIINYVDLLKKEDIADPTAREYIEVLDRKSQRLKKLTEDLVEASKASTGALTVEREQLDVAQLIRQATGEYEEKLTAAGLTLVLRLPETPVQINADGRHVWRVLDNLLGNCVKYALEGTRVYLDAASWNGNAVITVKNVSRQPLNIPAEQLVERFVRGDESRTTEGSGLGLSIARSLTELQGGQFSLDIDGDLFKARVAFPLA